MALKIFLTILIALAVCIILILSVKIKVRFSLSHTGNGNDIKLRIFVLNEKLGYSILGSEKKEDKPKSEKSKEDNKKESEKDEKNKNEGFLKKLENIHAKVIKYKYTYLSCREFAKKRFTVENLDLFVEFGLSDAAKTGIATGAVWAAVYNIFAFITRCAVVKKHNFNVNADYSNEKFDVKTDIIVSFRPISAAFILIYIFLKYNLISKKYEERFKEVY